MFVIVQTDAEYAGRSAKGREESHLVQRNLFAQMRCSITLYIRQYVIGAARGQSTNHIAGQHSAARPATLMLKCNDLHSCLLSIFRHPEICIFVAIPDESRCCNPVPPALNNIRDESSQDQGSVHVDDQQTQSHGSPSCKTQTSSQRWKDAAHTRKVRHRPRADTPGSQ